MRSRLRFLPVALLATGTLAALFAEDAPAKPAPSPERDAALLAAAKDAATVKAGKETYAALCLACHGAEQAKGDSPSNLFDTKWYHGSRPSEIERTVLTGFLEKNMPPWGEVLPPEDTTAVVAFILSQQK